MEIFSFMTEHQSLKIINDLSVINLLISRSIGKQYDW